MARLKVVRNKHNTPVYKKLLRSGKEKYAFEIMQLAREISESAE